MQSHDDIAKFRMTQISYGQNFGPMHTPSPFLIWFENQLINGFLTAFSVKYLAFL
jgi:hypothetical protein